MALSQSARDSAFVFAGSLFSRLLGFIRVILLASTLGFTRLSDSYSIANNTPNMMYELILGSVIASTMVPFFVQQLKQKDEKADHSLLSFAMITSAIISLITLMLSPVIAFLMTALNSSESGEGQQELVLFFLLFFLPQIFFYALTAVMQSYLAARSKFVMAAFAPIANNVVVISVLLYVKKQNDTFSSNLETLRSNTNIQILAIGTTLGVLTVTTLLAVSYLRAGGTFKLASIKHPNVRLLFHRSKWMIGYAVANQIALFGIMALSNADQGGVLTYTTAFLFAQLPHGLLAVTIMTTMIPRIAHTIETNEGSYKETITTARTKTLTRQSASALTLIMSFVCALQAATAIPALIILTAHGKVSVDDAKRTASVLIAFLSCLPAYSLYLYIVRLGNVLNKTRTLFYINVVQNIISISLAIIFFNLFSVAGLAFAFSLSYLLVLPLSIRMVTKSIGDHLFDKPFITHMVIVALISGALGYLVSINIDNVYLSVVASATTCLIALAIGSFMRISELKQLISLVYKRTPVAEQ